MRSNNMNDTVLKCEGMKLLLERFGMVDAERFIVLMNREPSDYTEWQRGLFENLSLDELNEKAMAYRPSHKSTAE
jgi:Ran GTPase-activating protein (RanGAP) involved in mRNA processing and transport